MCTLLRGLLLAWISLPSVEVQAQESSSQELALRAQGEYLLELDALPARPRVGAQLVSRGGSAYELTLWRGGLPGVGGQREGREHVAGIAKGAEIHFTHERGTLTWRAGKLHAAMKNWSEPLVFERVDRVSPTLGQAPPEKAIPLFTAEVNDFLERTDGEEQARVGADGFLESGAISKLEHGDALVHVEFCTPFEPADQGQARGNSGVYLQGRYEVQVLDSFGLEGKHNECGGIYSVRDPDSNACLPPGVWQTYDIEFRGARFDADGKKLYSARLTVYLNGIKIHDDVACHAPTTAAPVAESMSLGPLYLQDHGDAVRFRNVWLLPR